MTYKRSTTVALTLGAFVGFVNWGLDEVLISVAGHGHRTYMLFVDVITGCFAALAIFAVMYWARERKLRMLGKLEQVGEINHHIRNALQMITLANHDKCDPAMYQIMRDAVERIEWTLQEYLPTDHTPPRLGGSIDPKLCWEPAPGVTPRVCPLEDVCIRCHRNAESAPVPATRYTIQAQG